MLASAMTWNGFVPFFRLWGTLLRVNNDSRSGTIGVPTYLENDEEEDNRIEDHVRP